MEISFVYNGEPIPFSRPRTNGRVWFNDERYERYKRQLSRAINTAFGDLMLAEPLSLTARFFRSTKRKADLDNMVKALLDSAQDARLIRDDNHIEIIVASKAIDRAEPRVEFELTRIYP
jgi:Holliday junction resolvase RusA-like endonuclease